MRLLQVVADGNPGGGTTNVLALLEDLIGAGMSDVHFVSQSDSYALGRAHALGAKPYGVNFFRSRFDPRVPRQLSALVKRIRPDLVHIHGARAGFFQSFVPRNEPVAYTVRGYHFLKKPVGLRYLAALAERRASSRADVTIHVCEYDRRLARSWKLLPGGARNVVIYNGIRIEDIPEAAAPRPKSVGFLGRLTFQKDPLMVVEIARLLAPEGFAFRLIGGGELEPEVRARLAAYGLENAVELCGALPREQALAALRDVETFVFPSRWEGLPIAPVEAMQMGIPVVAAHVSGLPEIIESEVSGLLLEERSPARYAEAIRRLSSDAALRKRFADAGRRVVREKFTRQRVIAQHLTLYRELLKGWRG